ncbi:MAG: CbiX/SirB N-terminal domain-containing protein [Chthonomonadales bacterium]
MKKGILLFSHGSLLCGSESTLGEHVRRIQATGDFDLALAGFMNYSEPAFEDTVAEFVRQSVTDITVVPYFLVPGKFVRVDLPARVEAARLLHPELNIRVALPLGFDPALSTALITLAGQLRRQPDWRVSELEVRKGCRNRSDCPMYDVAICGTRTAIPKSNFSTLVANTFNTNPDETALLVMVHGSPRTSANAPMHEVLEVIRQSGRFKGVVAGFMECNEPDIPTAIRTCVESGAKAIAAVPYFLHTGNHVADDLPTILDQAVMDYPDIQFGMSAYLGTSEAVTDLLTRRSNEVSP